MQHKTEIVDNVHDIVRENTDHQFAVPGQLFVLRLPHPTDDGVVFETPAVVTGVVDEEFGPPTYNVEFFTRWKSGEVSGTIAINNLCVWRYVSDRLPTEEEIKLFEYMGEDLHFLTSVSTVSRNETSQCEASYVYPFVKDAA